jgi:hypothetical protein
VCNSEIVSCASLSFQACHMLKNQCDVNAQGTIVI